jgi:hypothetical protein
MTKEEFLAELSKTHDHFEWILDPDTSFPNERRSRPRYHLRALLKGSPEAIFDPLAALCYLRTGKVFEDKSWPDAARTLAMDSADAAMLLAATSDRTWETVAGDRRPVVPLVELRERLLEATRARPLPTASAPAPVPTAASGHNSPVPTRPWRMQHDAVAVPSFALVRGRRGFPGPGRGGSGIFGTVLAVLRSLVVGILAVFVSSFLYVATVAYIVGLAFWAARQYDGPVGIDVTSVFQRPSVLWIAALLIFGFVFRREYLRTSGQVR